MLPYSTFSASLSSFNKKMVVHLCRLNCFNHATATTGFTASSSQLLPPCHRYHYFSTAPPLLLIPPRNHHCNFHRHLHPLLPHTKTLITPTTPPWTSYSTPHLKFASFLSPICFSANKGQANMGVDLKQYMKKSKADLYFLNEGDLLQ